MISALFLKFVGKNRWKKSLILGMDSRKSPLFFNVQCWQLWLRLLSFQMMQTLKSTCTNAAFSKCRNHLLNKYSLLQW